MKPKREYRQAHVDYIKKNYSKQTTTEMANHLKWSDENGDPDKAGVKYIIRRLKQLGKINPKDCFDKKRKLVWSKIK